jgi:hypothetical protein
MAGNKIAHYLTSPQGELTPNGNLLEEALSRVSGIPSPDELLPLHLAPAVERRRRVLRVLRSGYSIWRRGDCTLVEAVREAGGENFALSHLALVEMRRLLLHLDLVSWESHPARLRSEVHSVFKRAIGRLTPHSGGHLVTPVH